MEVIPLRREPLPSSPRPMSNTDSPSLLEALRAGDPEAAEQLARDTYQQTFASLVRLCGGNRDLAADLCQETYRKAWSALGSFDERASFSTWLYRIAYNTFLNHLRGASRLKPLSDEHAAGLVDAASGPERVAGDRGLGERLRRAVVDLPDRQRFVVTAFYWGEVPVKDLAAEEGVTTVAIRKRLKKAMTNLRDSLQEVTR